MPEILASYNNGNMEIAVDKHSNMLIIGKAATRYSYKTISYEDDYNTVLKNYGDSDLTSAFKVAKDNDVEKVYYYNILNDRKENNDNYQRLVAILKDHLRYDEEGNMISYNVNQDRLTEFLKLNSDADLFK